MEDRTTYIGGSDAAAAVGLGTWGSPYTVWLHKRGQSEERPPTERMAWGLVLERPVAEEWARREGWTLVPGKFRRDPAREHVGGHADFLAYQQPEDDEPPLDALVEVKLSDRPGDFLGQDGEDVVPMQYFLQVQHYLHVFDLRVAFLVVLFRGSELRSYRIERDQEVIDGLLEAYDDLWAHVVDGTEPVIDGHEATAAAIKARFPENTDEEIVGSHLDVALVEGLLAVRRDAAQVETTKTELENRIKARMGTAAKLLVPGVVISWKQNKPSVQTNWQAVAGAYRSLLDDVINGEGGMTDRLMRLSEAPDFDTLESIHTDTIPGARPFRVTVKARGDEG